MKGNIRKKETCTNDTTTTAVTTTTTTTVMAQIIPTFLWVGKGTYVVQIFQVLAG